MRRRALRAGAIAVALSVAGVGGSANAEGSQELAVDLSGEVGADGIVKLDAQVGPILFHEALIQNRPTPDELRGADDDDTAEPRIMLVIDSSARERAVLDLRLQLEDEAGALLVTCAGVEIQSAAWKDVIKVCKREPEMKLQHWPRVKTLRVLGSVKARG